MVPNTAELMTNLPKDNAKPNQNMMFQQINKTLISYNQMKKLR